KATTSASASASATKATPSATPTPTPQAFPTDVAAASKIAVSQTASSVARTPEEKATVQSLTDYWAAVVRTYDTLQLDPGLKIARGQALTRVMGYLQDLRGKAHKVKGWTRDHVQKISIDGDKAALVFCTENFTFEVDAQGRKAEDITPFYLATMRLQKIDGRWIVTELADNQKLQKSCLT
ncbi:MAG: hypothetical protein EON52_14680, partial [Actinomycetales bacterium]